MSEIKSSPAQGVAGDTRPSDKPTNAPANAPTNAPAKAQPLEPAPEAATDQKS
jgi:hypothetical protein